MFAPEPDVLRHDLGAIAEFSRTFTGRASTCTLYAVANTSWRGKPAAEHAARIKEPRKGGS
jgi:hypothetical protein